MQLHRSPHSRGPGHAPGPQWAYPADRRIEPEGLQPVSPSRGTGPLPRRQQLPGNPTRRTGAGYLIQVNIEGEILDPDQVRSCVAARLGLDAGESLRPIPAVEGIVSIMVDATARYREGTDRRTPPRLALMALSPGKERAPAGPGPEPGAPGRYRSSQGHVGRERVHFEGPEPERVPGEMSAFLEWFNRPPETDGVLRAGMAHLWFVAVHPLEDGNGRIARAITDMTLARSQQSPMRLYSVSHRILRERDAYYHALENATRGTCDITAWLNWFAGCLGRAMDDALEALSVAEQNAALRERAGQLPLNHRQLRVLELLIREPEETLTTGRWARINRSTREEAEADTDRMDGMVRAMLLGESPQESVNPTYRLARGG